MCQLYSSLLKRLYDYYFFEIYYVKKNILCDCYFLIIFWTILKLSWKQYLTLIILRREFKY